MEKVKEVKQEFYGLDSILETVKNRLAAATSEEAKAAQEISHLQVEVQKAALEFHKLQEEGKLTPDAISRSTAALATLPAEIAALSSKLTDEILEKRKLAIEKSGEELDQRINQQREKTFAEEIAGWDLAK